MSVGIDIGSEMVTVRIPKRLVTSLTIPKRSIVDGSVDAQFVTVHSLVRGMAFGPAVRLGVPAGGAWRFRLSGYGRITAAFVLVPVGSALLLWSVIGTVTDLSGAGQGIDGSAGGVYGAVVAVLVLVAIVSNRVPPQLPRVEGDDVVFRDVSVEYAEALVRDNPTVELSMIISQP